jgi:hypothetical protein
MIRAFIWLLYIHGHNQSAEVFFRIKKMPVRIMQFLLNLVNGCLYYIELS